MQSYYQNVGLLTSAILGFMVATYLMHHEIQFKHTLDDAKSLASFDWSDPDAKEVVDGVRPFRISFTYSTISDLLIRLALARKCTSNRQESCYSSDDLTSDVLDYWTNKYDFKSREAHLNRHPQFIQNVQGLDIHYYHVKPKASSNSSVSPWPLLILHGWSSSPAEFINLMTNLTSPDYKVLFEVIVPSLPGFGFSGNPEGLGPVGMAHVMKSLMSKLGHERFLLQGNDLGAEVAANMAVMYPHSILGLHSTMCRASPTGFWVPIKAALLSKLPWLLSDPEERELVSNLKRVVKVLYRDDGITRDVSRILTLEDSPVALTVQMLQRYSVFEDRDIDLDVVVDNLMFYWVSNKIESSLRIFKEIEHDKKYKLDRIPVRVPTTCVGLHSHRNRMPVTLLRHRFQKLERYTSSDSNVTSVLSNPSFSSFLADDIVKTFASLNLSP